MKVLFIQNIKNVARIGDMKNIPDGYARNFLFPRKLAKPATRDAVQEAEELKKQRETSDIKNRTEAEELATKLEGGVVEILEGANPEGHLYGSVDAKKIVEAIHATYHIKISPDHVDLPHHLKTTGDHQVKVELRLPAQAGQTIATTLTVRVLSS